MRVFVTGATGALGRHLVPALVAAGHEVTATTRTPSKAGRLREVGAEPVIVDGLDREAVIAAVRAAAPEVIVHEMTALAGMRSLRHPDKLFAATNELRTRGTDNLLAAAAEAGTRRVIAQSYAGAGPDKRPGPVTEDDPPEWRPIRSAMRGPAAIAHVEKTVPAQALEGVVLRYGGFYGPGASDILLDAVRKRQVPVIGGGTGVWSFIEITDAAAATLAAARLASTTSWTTTRRRSRSGCPTWPRSRARSRRCACPPGSGGCSPESSCPPACKLTRNMRPRVARPRPSHPRRTIASVLPSQVPDLVSSLRENHQRPNETVLTPSADGHDIPAAINSPGQPAGARSFSRAHGPGGKSAHLPAATRHRVCRMATR